MRGLALFLVEQVIYTQNDQNLHLLTKPFDICRRFYDLHNFDLNRMNTPALKLLYADTNSLIYAYEQQMPDWKAMFDEHFSDGYRLALTEENLLEFAKSHTPKAAVTLAQRVVDLSPVWLRSFIDIQSDEVRSFVELPGKSESIPTPQFYRSTFEAVSQIGERQKLGPIQFVELLSSEKAKSMVQEIHQTSANNLDVLKHATKSGALTKGHLDLAFRNAISRRLGRGSDLTAPLTDLSLEKAVKSCVKHQKWLLRECPSLGAEHHLANYRSLNPNRMARVSDAVDLTTAVAALPYVSAFITNDGFLLSGLEYVKKKMPSITAMLIRRPNAA